MIKRDLIFYTKMTLAFAIIPAYFTLAACLSSEEQSAEAERLNLESLAVGRPTYIIDTRTNLCFVDFPNQSYDQPMETPCSPEVLEVIREQNAG